MSNRRRLREQKQALLRKVEQLRMVCVTQRMLLDCRELQLTDLRDALAFFDRVAASKSEWTAADVRRLAELRKLAAEP